MLLRTKVGIASSEITPESTYRAWQLNRRELLMGLGAVGAAAMLPVRAWSEAKLPTVPSKYKVNEATTPEAKAKSYNNFYEFGVDKSDPAKNAHTLRPRPWSVKVDGLVKKPQVIDLDKIAGYRPIEERVYRFRCVEGWSMVIPWAGYSLAEFIKAMDPLPSAKFVQFFSLADKSQMPELDESGINPPYSEGLRMDEAMNPLTLLTFGSYGQTLANQQGAPIRVMVPWKYGFKSPKSIVQIRFVDKMPRTTWNDLNAPAYGFYSNVNPNVAPWHDQSRERLLNSNSFLPKIVPTQMFNGYSAEVAGMYAGMDLVKNY